MRGNSACGMSRQNELEQLLFDLLSIYLAQCATYSALQGSWSMVGCVCSVPPCLKMSTRAEANSSRLLFKEKKMHGEYKQLFYFYFYICIFVFRLGISLEKKNSEAFYIYSCHL